MSSHNFAFDISVGAFICTKCFVDKDSKDAALGCGTPEQKALFRKQREELFQQGDDAAVILAASGLSQGPLEPRLHPALKALLDAIYKRVTGCARAAEVEKGEP